MKAKHTLAWFKAEQSAARWLQRNGIVCRHLRGNGPHDIVGKSGTRIEVKFARPRRRKKHITWTFQLSRPRGKQAKKVLDESGVDAYIFVLRPAFLGRHRVFLVMSAPQKVQSVVVSARSLIGKHRDTVFHCEVIREMERRVAKVAV